jgi:membrane fusion protein, multidrug efflux system
VRDINKQTQQHASTITQPTEISRSSTLEPITRDPNGPPDSPRQPRGKMWIWLIVLAVLAFGIWVAFRLYESHARAAAAKPKGNPSTPVVAAAARKGDIPVYFTGLGAVTPIYTVTIKTRVDGQIDKVNYTEGQAVRKEQPLVEIDSRPYQVQLTQAEGQLMKDQALLQNAQTDLARYEDLIKKNAVAQQIYATQKSTVAQDEGNVKTDEGNIASAKLNIAYCHIIAPITGRVGLRLVDPGNLVNAASATPLAVITQTQPISVIFTLPEEQVPAVLKRARAGQKLHVDALDRESKNVIAGGELTTLDNVIDQTTGTLKFRATFPNKDEVLFPNQFVNARLLVEEKKSITLIPNGAIQRNGSTTFVYLLDPSKNTVTIRNVKLATADADDTEVVSGLEPGDVVITQGVDKLQEGSHVQAQIQQPGGKPAQGADGNGANAPNNGNANPNAPQGQGRHGKSGSQDGAKQNQ